MSKLAKGDIFELGIHDEWNPSLEPQRPVLVRFDRVTSDRDYWFTIMSGGIVDRLTGESLREISARHSSGPPELGHLSGLKVSVDGRDGGRALLIKLDAP